MKNSMYRVTLFKMQSVQTNVRITLTDQLESASVTSLIYGESLYGIYVYPLDLKHILMEFQ